MEQQQLNSDSTGGVMKIPEAPDSVSTRIQNFVVGLLIVAALIFMIGFRNSDSSKNAKKPVPTPYADLSSDNSEIPQPESESGLDGDVIISPSAEGQPDLEASNRENPEALVRDRQSSESEPQPSGSELLGRATGDSRSFSYVVVSGFATLGGPSGIPPYSGGFGWTKVISQEERDWILAQWESQGLMAIPLETIAARVPSDEFAMAVFQESHAESQWVAESIHRETLQLQNEEALWSVWPGWPRGLAENRNFRGTTIRFRLFEKAGVVKCTAGPEGAVVWDHHKGSLLGDLPWHDATPGESLYIRFPKVRGHMHWVLSFDYATAGLTRDFEAQPLEP